MDRLPRHLCAVLALDVAGYARLMAANEEGTHTHVRALLEGAAEPRIAEFGGEVFKRMGDAILAEFPSVVDAIRCALSIQQEAEARAATAPQGERIRLRIGIGLGDVIREGGDRFGDGVNLAARLEGIAGAGEVLVAEAAVRVAEGTGLAFQDLGLKTLKHLLRPVRTYRALPDGSGQSETDPGMLVPGFGDRPAIAVLPFRAASDDAAFADGLAEDLITALAGWRSFPVISRASSFLWRGRDADVREIGQTLGARYVLDGAVRRAGTRVRVTAGMADSESGDTLLAERFEGGADDLFALQDEIARTMLGRLEPELLRREGERARKVPPPRASTYELYHLGLWHHYRYTAEDNRAAQEALRAALALEPSSPPATAALALTLCHAVRSNWAPPEPTYTEALALAQRAVQLDPSDPGTQYALGMVLSHLKRVPESMERLRAVIQLHPSHAAAHAMLAFSYNYLDCPDKALTHIGIALRLSPQDPRRFIWLPALAAGHYLGGNYKQALAVAQEGMATNPGYLLVLRYAAAAMGHLGKRAEAVPLLALLRRLDPDRDSVDRFLAHFVPSAAGRILDGLCKVGFC